ncbi:MAG TPA: AMP-binding protein, partial [Candidatus Limnocylindria bacterium]|nr:AMP-binding protein [Candidatus Limnocylindria bacterium]
MTPLDPKVARWKQDASSDPDHFWRAAAEALPWFRRPERVLEWTPPTFRWFGGGRTNLAYNSVDHHVATGAGDRVALITENERGQTRRLTYAELLGEVRRVSAALRGLGIAKGDRIAIYMPTSAEAIVLMLGAIRIGAIILVVFAGFGAGALGERVRLAGARALFATDVTYRKGKDVPLKGIVDEALRDTPTVERVVVLRRGSADVPMTEGRDITWEAFLAGGAGHDEAHVECEANEPAYILATSGTTAKPKLAVHTHGGYQVYVHAMGRWMFGLGERDVWWSTSDIGWVVGHSYIVFGPLLAGCTTIAYEGALDHPDAETFYRIIERN